ncbi:hypothetical protein L2E82_48754 [Cichorium intybus]|uniref:Uncharacterized protein n=1 Tax=Cichorium intybus TaxID=13427 RepID=A0ACB8YZT3_CICIN|nr:hypothetical protein L2E82_48754 [Cichorium intybus]
MRIHEKPRLPFFTRTPNLCFMKPKSCNVDDDWRRWIEPVTMAIVGGGSQAQTTSTTTIGGGGYDPLIPVASD